MGSVEILTEKFETKSNNIAPLDIDMALDDVKKMKGDPAHNERLGKLRKAIENNKDKFQRSKDIDDKLVLLQKELPERSFTENAQNAATELLGDVVATGTDMKERFDKGDYKGMVTEHPYIASFLAWTGLKWVSSTFLSFFHSDDDEKKEPGPIRKMFGYAVDAVGITALAKLIEQYSDTKNATPAQPNPAPVQPPNAPPKSTDPDPNAPKNAPLAVKLGEQPSPIEMNGKKYDVALKNGQIVLNNEAWKIKGKGKAAFATFTIDKAEWNSAAGLQTGINVSIPLKGTSKVDQMINKDMLAQLLKSVDAKQPFQFEVPDPDKPTEKHKLEFALAV
jgi:hypothetical protein